MAEVEIVITGRDNYSSVLGDFGNIITGIKSAIDLVGQAFDAAAGAITPFINSASESEQAVARLEGILRATGGAAGLTSEQLQGMANGLQGVTRFSDETILAGASLLLTFRNISGETFERTVPAMLDMAEIFGSVDSAAMQLGKALNDPLNMLGALTRAGVTFSDEQKEMIKNFVETGNVAAAQNIILTEVENQVGGLAEMMGNTFAGQVEIARNKLDEIRETIGNAILPVLTNLLTKFSEFVSKPEVIEFFTNLSESISDFLTNLNLEEGFSGFLDTIFTAMETGDWTPVWDSIKDAIMGGWNIIAPVIDDLFGRLFAWMEKKVNEWIDGGGPDRLSNNIIDALNDTFASPEFQTKATTAFEALINTLIRALGLIEWGKIGETIGDNISNSFNQMEISGTDAVRNFFNDIETSITDAVRGWFDNIELDATTWVREKIVDPIKQFLGIASASTVFMEIGRDIVLGLIGGLGSLLGTLWSIVKFIGEGIIQGIWDGAKGLITSFFEWLSGIAKWIVQTLAPILQVFGIDVSGFTGSTTGSTGGTTTSVGGLGTGSTGTGTGTVVNQYFAGATINVGSWDKIAYDCIYPNPFVAATSGQLGSFGNNTGLNGGGV